MGGDLVDFAGQGEGPARSRRKRGNTVGCLTGLFFLLVVVVLVLGAIVGLQAWQVYGKLRTAGDDFAALQTQISDNPSKARDTTLPALQRVLGEAKETMNGPTMTTAAKLPWLGPNVDAVNDVTSGLDRLAQDALPPLVAASTVIDPATGELRETADDPQALLESMTTAMGALEEAPAAVDTVSEVKDELDAIDTAGLQPEVADAVDQVRQQVSELAEKVEPYRTTFEELSAAKDDLGQSGDQAKELLDRLRR